jgi:hypothetical protein
MIKLTIQLMARLHDRLIRSSAYAAFRSWFCENICAPVTEPTSVAVTVISSYRLSRWQD